MTVGRILHAFCESADLTLLFRLPRSAGACNPFNSQLLISHLTNSNGCGNL